MAEIRDTYAERLAAALERSGVSKRELARKLAEREGGSLETKRRNIYKWLDGDEGSEPEPLRAGVLAIMLNAPELAVVSAPRQSAASRVDAHLEVIANDIVEIQENQKAATPALFAELQAIRETLDTLLAASRTQPRQRTGQ